MSAAGAGAVLDVRGRERRPYRPGKCGHRRLTNDSSAPAAVPPFDRLRADGYEGFRPSPFVLSLSKHALPQAHCPIEPPLTPTATPAPAGR